MNDHPELDLELFDAHLEGRLPAAATAELEARLAADPQLRAAWLARGRLRRGGRPLDPALVEEGARRGLAAAGRRPLMTALRPLLLAASLVLVAGVVVEAVRRGAARPEGPPDATTRAAPPGAPAAPRLVEPAEGTPLEEVERFLWQPVDGVIDYRLVLVAIDGATVASRRVEAASVPRSELSALPAGSAHGWYVEARWPDRPATASPVRRFAGARDDSVPRPP